MGAKWRAVLCIVGFLTSSSFLTIYSASISDPRIVGGDPVNGNSRYPFMVALYQLIGGAKQFRCGGTLIGSNIVLCAAHCFDYVDYVEVGRYDRLDSNEEGVRGFSIIEKVVHPLYEGDSDTSADHDVMVIQIDGDASDLPKVTLDTNDGQVSLEPGTDLIVMGWGHTSYEGSTSQEVELDFIEQDVCSQNYDSIVIITDNMICAAREGKDSCQGDSGGPLITADGRDIQVGIVSFGEGCADLNYPGVYASVAAHYDWIISLVDQWEKLLSPMPTLVPSLSLSPTSILNRDLFEVTLDGTFSWFGNMFDVVSLRTEIAIHNFYLHIMNENELESIVIFTRKGTHASFERDESQWYKICDTEVEPQGLKTYTVLERNALFEAVIIGPSSVQSFYITLTKSSSTTLLYSSGREVGAVYVQNMDIALLEGTSNGYPLFGQFFQPRVWNGAIIYTYQSIPTSDPSELPTIQPVSSLHSSRPSMVPSSKLNPVESSMPTNERNPTPSSPPTFILSPTTSFPTVGTVPISSTLPPSQSPLNQPSITSKSPSKQPFRSNPTQYPSHLPNDSNEFSTTIPSQTVTNIDLTTKSPTTNPTMEFKPFPPTPPLITGAPVGASPNQSNANARPHINAAYIYVIFSSLVIIFAGDIIF